MTTSLSWRYARSSALGLLLLFLVTPFATSQASLTNDSDYLLVFQMVTQEEWETRGSLLWESDPQGFFDRMGNTLAFVPPGGVREMELPEAGALAGYFAEPSRSDWPLLQISLAPGESVRLSPDGAERRLPADQLPTLAEPVLLDGRFADWENEPHQAAFATSYEPGRFIRERRGERTASAIGQSQGWGRPGTRLEGIKLARGEGRVYLFLSFQEPPEEAAQLLIYLYGNSRERPLGTLLLEPAAPSGPVDLHLPGSTEPRRAGNIVRVGPAVEGEIVLDQLPASLGGEFRFAVISTVIELETTYEEFPITRIERSDIED